MRPGKYNFSIVQGDTFRRTITWKQPSGNPVNLTGYTAKMQLRLDRGSPDPLFELSTVDGRIALGGAAGTIALLVSSADTASLDFESAVYDLEVVSAGGEKTTLLFGEIRLQPEVTR